MVLLDTNIFIYIANGKLGRQIIANADIAHTSVTKIEALGFPDIQANEQIILRQLFNESYVLDLTNSVNERAITLKQLRRMSLGDAIVAASALENDLVLWTANIKDFDHITELQLVNPLAELG